MKRRGILRLSPELLFSLLGLNNAILLDAKVNQFESGCLDIVIESSDMPECMEGAYPLTVTLEDIKCHTML